MEEEVAQMGIYAASQAVLSGQEPALVSRSGGQVRGVPQPRGDLRFAALGPPGTVQSMLVAEMEFALLAS